MRVKTAAFAIASLMFSLLSLRANAQSPASRAAKIDPEVQTALDSLPSGQMLPVIVTLQDQADLTHINSADKATRQRAVVQELKDKAIGSQTALSALLAARQRQGLVGEFSSLWIVSAISVNATKDAILELAARPDVDKITPDQIFIVPVAVPAAGAPQPNLTAINAPALWSIGLQGQGVVIANLDTGVDVTHPDLSTKYRGGTNSWFDPYGQHPTTPTDFSGHGTATMGVMVGGDASGSSIGVAPQATWIAARIFNDAGSSTATAIHRAYQWILDPDGNPNTADAPDVVNNSWTYGAPGCNLEFQPDLKALRASGILPVFAAGNFGPGTSTSASPANYPEAFAVGSVDNNDVLASFSSLGPTTCGQSQAIFPEVMAPGVNITTTDLYGLYNTVSGTSLSSPHVAGALALLLSANPALTAVQQEQALINSAVDLGTTGPDNVFGYGRINDLAAYNYMSSGPVVSGASATPSPASGSAPVHLAASLTDGASTLASAEYFIDKLGPDGSGNAMLAADGTFNSLTESINADISLTTLSQLADGTHTVHMHGRNAAGKWGLLTSASFSLFKNPPAVSGVNVTPNPTNGTAKVTLTATASSNVSTIAAAEWYQGVDPGTGLGTPMSAADGAYNGASEALTASISTSGWTTGNRTLYVRAKDAVGIWSSSGSVVLNVTSAPKSTVSTVSATPNPTAGVTTVTLTATASSTNSTIAAAEWFQGTDPGAGLGTPMTAADGAFNSASEQVRTSVSTVGWAVGNRTLYVRAKDAAGLWGTAGSVVLSITAPPAPTISGIAASPNPTAGATTITLTATGSAANSTVAAAEWYQGADPGAGLGTAMSATDGAFNGTSEAVQTTISTTGWAAGSRTLYVRVRNAAGSWSASGSVTVNVTSNAIFSDGFESGNFAAWSSAAGSGSSISVAASALRAGSYGMKAVISGGASGYVKDNTPTNETSYHARFYFNPNGVSISSTPQDLFIGFNSSGTAVFRVQMRRSGNQFQIREVVATSGGTSSTNWYAISNAYHPIEIAWQSSSSAASTLYIDGSAKQTLSGLNTGSYTLKSVNLGPQGSPSSVSGTEYFDSFVSTRTTYIGP